MRNTLASTVASLVMAGGLMIATAAQGALAAGPHYRPGISGIAPHRPAHHAPRHPRRSYTAPTSMRHHVTRHKRAAADGVTPALTQMLGLINAERAQAGVAPLNVDPTLNAVAQARSQDMVDRNYFDHQIPAGAPQLPRGGMVFDILDHNNVQYEMAGENLALNNYISFYPLAQTVSQTNTDLMNSPEHRQNILEPKFTKIGLGLAFQKGTGKLILTEVFVQP